MREQPRRKLIVAITFVTDLQHWIAIDGRLAIRILRMVLEIGDEPWSGIGKPEPLRHNLSGRWSRRVDQKHRLIYRFDDDAVEFISAQSHYG